MEFEKLLKLVSDYGAMIAGFTVLLAATIAGTKLLYDYFSLKIKNSDTSCPRANTDCPGKLISAEDLKMLITMRNGLRQVADLRNHQLFGTIRAYRSTTIPSLQIKDPGRRLVFQDILLTKFATVAIMWDKWLNANAEALKNDRMDGQFLYNEMLMLISNIVEAYEEQSLQMKIPVEAITAFRQWHEASIDSLIDSVQATSHSEWIAGSTQRVGLCMSYFESTLQRTLIDAEGALNSLNGSLTGKKYKGVTCGEPTVNMFFKKLTPPRYADREGDSGMHKILKDMTGETRFDPPKK